jgi:hypothetical protein
MRRTAYAFDIYDQQERARLSARLTRRAGALPRLRRPVRARIRPAADRLAFTMKVPVRTSPRIAKGCPCSPFAGQALGLYFRIAERRPAAHPHALLPRRRQLVADALAGQLALECAKSFCNNIGTQRQCWRSPKVSAVRGNRPFSSTVPRAPDRHGTMCYVLSRMEWS